VKILLKQKHLDDIAGLCLMHYPNVACGYLLGDTLEEDKRLLFPYSVRNLHPEPQQKFIIDEETYIHVENHAKNRKADIIGIFRSVLVSEDEDKEVEEALLEDAKTAQPWSTYLYIPIIRSQNSIGCFACYRLVDGKFTMEEVDLENWRYNG